MLDTAKTDRSTGCAGEKIETLILQKYGGGGDGAVVFSVVSQQITSHTRRWERSEPSMAPPAPPWVGYNH